MSSHSGRFRLICSCDLAECIFVGYPFDIPGEDSNMLTYAALGYHLPLLIAFSLQQKTHFVWGGFMLFKLKDLLLDQHSIMQVGHSQQTKTFQGRKETFCYSCSRSCILSKRLTERGGDASMDLYKPHPENYIWSDEG